MSDDQDRIYLDHQATTPVDERVMETMQPYFTETYGNAASNDHLYGVDAHQAVDEARSTIAEALGAKSDEVIFTSGATESDNIAVFGVAERYENEGKHIITCKTEHKAVLDPCKELEERGWEVTYLPVDEHGMIDLGDLRSAIREDTTLVSIMMANNEVGTIAPIQEIGAIAREHGAKFHTDAAQCLGHIPIDVDEMNIDLMSASAHKCYGPKGIGMLYCRRSRPRVDVEPQIHGGGHERGLRSGTLNVPAIVGFGKSVEVGLEEMDKENERFREWTDRMFDHLQEKLGDVKRNGHPEKRLAHNLNVYIPGIESRALIVDLKETAIATGSACTSADVEPSHVITSMYDEQRAHSSVRISVGRANEEEQINEAAQRISDAAEQLRAFAL
ncbi:cysteine desulfurase family protein [Salinibacter ruber]|uniref:cysteine desulfurase family protein n=1 Tax=Salinibacter ruber TaxID=146919 RepID=UPI00216814F3|nr:cysteine desulfurase family protein [Salinibacter ruber]MCS4149278.1 cysteine desulfurase [Salinibacter ruber]